MKRIILIEVCMCDQFCMQFHVQQMFWLEVDRNEILCKEIKLLP